MKKLLRCMSIIAICLGLLIASSPVGAEATTIEPKGAIVKVSRELEINENTCVITVSGTYETNGKAAYNINLNARVTGGTCSVLSQTYTPTSNGRVKCSIRYRDSQSLYYPDFVV